MPVSNPAPGGSATSSTTPARPILFLDVDGVLNPLGSPPGYREHRIEGFPILLNPDHRWELLDLARDFDLAWATTWEDDANVEIGPRLGLPSLPVVHFEFDSKWPDIVDFAGTRPFAWLDDNAGPDEVRWANDRDRRVAPTLIVQVNAITGVRDADFATVRAFLGRCRNPLVV